MNLGFTEEINGRPTFFIEKIWASFGRQHANAAYRRYKNRYKKRFGQDWDMASCAEQAAPKVHTIRRGKRWQAGEPICFTINKNNLTDFQFAPVLACECVQDIEILYYAQNQFPVVYIDGKQLPETTNHDPVQQLAANDGFSSLTAFFAYFDTDFTGQLVHWTKLKY